MLSLCHQERLPARYSSKQLNMEGIIMDFRELLEKRRKEKEMNRRPQFGVLNGKRISLDAKTIGSLTDEDKANVEVEINGEKLRIFRQSVGVHVDKDGKLHL